MIDNIKGIGTLNYGEKEKDMRKSIIAIALSGILTVCFFTNVMAVDYMEKADRLLYEYDIDDEGISINGTGLALSDTDPQPEIYNGEADEWEIKEYNVEDKNGEDMNVPALSHLLAQNRKAKVIRLFNVESDDAEEGAPVEITLADNAVKAGKNYKLFVLEGGGYWNPSLASVVSVKDGVVKAKLSKASSVALVEIKAPSAVSPIVRSEGEAAKKDSRSADTKAPKTGEI